MALFTPSASPAITVKEIDLTGGVPNVQSTTGAFAGAFSWGPVDEPILISNEAGLVRTFGAPSNEEAVDLISASYFLKYSNSMYVVRTTTDAAKNAIAKAGGVSVTATLVKNDADFSNLQSSLDSDNHLFIAQYAGKLGNSLKVSFCQDSSNFATWTYKNEVSGKPGTSASVAAVNGKNDEFHLVVLDEDGLITGTKGTVLESFEYLSKAKDQKNEDGSTSYAPEVINRKSQYIRMAGWSASAFPTNAGDSSSGTDFRNASYLTNTNYSFDGGQNSGTLTNALLDSAYSVFDDTDKYEIDFMIAPQVKTRANHKTLVGNLISKAENTRKDCVVVSSPPRDDVVDLSASDAVTATVAAMNDITFSSYAVFDNAFLKVYDKFNDKYIWIPAASSTAGIMAASDANTAPWFSPAGPRRGRYFGITGLSYSPDKAQRDTLYKAGINPIANIPGQGVLLYGDKTHMTRVSAFDRINVRRLFLILERAIARAAVNTLFEFNDEFTRAEFVNIVEPVLRNVKGRRGITDFRVVCDETNNTADVIDRNEFIASIFIKPARSINYITLNFVGVRTGVDFEEVVGTV